MIEGRGKLFMMHYETYVRKVMLMLKYMVKFDFIVE